MEKAFIASGKIAARFVLQPIVTTLVGQAALYICHASNFYPERFLGDALMGIPQDLAYWILLAASSGALWWLADWWFYRRLPEASSGVSKDLVVAAGERDLPLSFIELADLAIPDFGTIGEARGFYLWDLCVAVRQAAIYGMLIVDGRKSTSSEHDQWLLAEPLVQIPASEWTDKLEIACEPWVFNERDNSKVFAARIGEIKYRDISIRSSQVARRWLADAWPKEKGKMYAAHLALEERRSALRGRVEASTEAPGPPYAAVGAMAPDLARELNVLATRIFTEAPYPRQAALVVGDLWDTARRLHERLHGVEGLEQLSAELRDALHAFAVEAQDPDPNAPRQLQHDAHEWLLMVAERVRTATDWTKSAVN